ncbi:MAG: hypothetical protein KAT15_12870 [Bacteroidales bacterium]|nr:hypothetical protein [Bacteroidales bacterium]
MNGSELVFDMGPDPNMDWGKEKSDRPFSENSGPLLSPLDFENGRAAISLPFVASGEKLFQESAAAGEAGLNEPAFTQNTEQVKNTAQVKNTEQVMNLTQGLNYDYFERFFVTTGDLDKVSPLESGVTENFTIGIAGKETYFGFRYSGFINAPKDGIYTFYLESNDGSRLFIDGEEIIENDANHGAIEEQGSVGLKAGLHEILLTYFQCGGGKKLKVSWEGPGFSKREIHPAELLCEKNKS